MNGAKESSSGPQLGARRESVRFVLLTCTVRPGDSLFLLINLLNTPSVRDMIRRCGGVRVSLVAAQSPAGNGRKGDAISYLILRIPSSTLVLVENGRFVCALLVPSLIDLCVRLINF